MKTTIKLLSLLVALGLFSGCANMSSQKAPDFDVTRIKSFYVVKLPADNRGINQKIADQLNLMGYKASTGAAEKPADPVDAIVTYQDKWMWDITMYMLQLEVQLRNPTNNFTLASGKSYRPSLQRKSPDEMIREVLESVLKKS